MAYPYEKLDLKVGDSYQMKIIKLIPAERKVGFSAAVA